MAYDRDMWKGLGLVITVALISVGMFWAPFLTRVDKLWGIEFFKRGMETIVENFDGLNFLVVAKSMYKPELIQELNQSFLTGNDPLYFTAHYPGLPIIIKLLDTILTGPQAILVSILFSNIILATGLFLLYREFAKRSGLAVLLTIVSLFLPARMLSDRMVGSNEPLFIGLVLLSLVLAKRSKHWGSAILGSLAIVTRSPGILLFGGYLLSIWLMTRSTWQEKLARTVPYLLMPITLVLIWGFYGYQHHNFLAYFQSGVSLNMHFPPFLIFGTSQEWISGMWREEIIYIYLLFGLGIGSLYTRYKNSPVFSYGAIYLLSILFVAHRDLARYSLPIAPLVILGFEEYLQEKWVRWILIAMIIPIYLMGWQFVIANIQPVADWSGLL